jgi:hypothetical protein
MRTPDAPFANFTESFTVTVAFDLPSGTVDVDAASTFTLPHCPADIPTSAGSFVEHCDRSVDAYLVYNPGYEAGPTTITFSGSGYGQVGQFAPVSKDVTVTPGQTAHAFFDADHGYSVQVAQQPSVLVTYATFVNVPDGCPYLPAPGSPAALAATPSTDAAPPAGGTQPAGGSQPGGGLNPASGAQPGGPGPPLGVPGPQAAFGSAEPLPSDGVTAPQAPSRAVATTQPAPISWYTASGAALAGGLIAMIIVVAARRRLRPALPRLALPRPAPTITDPVVDPSTEDNPAEGGGP